MYFEINAEILQNLMHEHCINCSNLSMTAHDVRKNFLRADCKVFGYALINKRYPMFITSTDVTGVTSHTIRFNTAALNIPSVGGFVITEEDHNAYEPMLHIDNIERDFIFVAIRDEDSFDRFLFDIEDYYSSVMTDMAETCENDVVDNGESKLSSGDDNFVNRIANIDDLFNPNDENVIDDYLKNANLADDGFSGEESAVNNLETNKNNLFII